MSEVPSEIKVSDEDQTDLETETSSRKKQSLGVRIVYWSLLIIAWSVVMFLCVARTMTARMLYADGLANESWIITVLIEPFLIQFVVFPVLVISAMLFLLIIIKLKKQHIIVGVVTILCVCSAVFFYVDPFNWCSRPSRAEVYLEGFEKWVFENVELGNIQEWISTTDEKYWESDHSGGPGPGMSSNFYRSGVGMSVPGHLPSYFLRGEIQYLMLRRSKLDDSKTVEYEWGGAPVHWGVVIGEPEMQMPEDGYEWHSRSLVEFRRILRPGVYVYAKW